MENLTEMKLLFSSGFFLLPVTTLLVYWIVRYLLKNDELGRFAFLTNFSLTFLGLAIKALKQIEDLPSLAEIRENPQDFVTGIFGYMLKVLYEVFPCFILFEQGLGTMPEGVFNTTFVSLLTMTLMGLLAAYIITPISKGITGFSERGEKLGDRIFVFLGCLGSVTTIILKLFVGEVVFALLVSGIISAIPGLYPRVWGGKDSWTKSMRLRFLKGANGVFYYAYAIVVIGGINASLSCEMLASFILAWAIYFVASRKLYGRTVYNNIERVSASVLTQDTNGNLIDNRPGKTGWGAFKWMRMSFTYMNEGSFAGSYFAINKTDGKSMYVDRLWWVIIIVVYVFASITGARSWHPFDISLNFINPFDGLLLSLPFWFIGFNLLNSWGSEYVDEHVDAAKLPLRLDTLIGKRLHEFFNKDLAPIIGALSGKNLVVGSSSDGDSLMELPDGQKIIAIPEGDDRRPDSDQLSVALRVGNKMIREFMDNLRKESDISGTQLVKMWVQLKKLAKGTDGEEAAKGAANPKNILDFYSCQFTTPTTDDVGGYKVGLRFDFPGGRKFVTTTAKGAWFSRLFYNGFSKCELHDSGRSRREALEKLKEILEE